VCAPMRRQRPVMARPWRWWLACCKATTEVRGVLRRVPLSRGCTALAQGALVVRLADGACPSGLMDPMALHLEIGAQDEATGGDAESV